MCAVARNLKVETCGDAEWGFGEAFAFRRGRRRRSGIDIELEGGIDEVGNVELSVAGVSSRDEVLFGSGGG